MHTVNPRATNQIKKKKKKRYIGAEQDGRGVKRSRTPSPTNTSKKKTSTCKTTCTEH